MIITVQILLSLILGLIICFFGYRLKRIAFAIAWFLIGYMLCAQFAPDLFHNLMPQIENPELWIKVLPIAVGLLLSLMGLSIERLCISTLTYIAVVAVAIQHFGFSFPVFAIASIIGVIAGIFAVKLMKPAIIALTAFVGAHSITTGALGAFPVIPGTFNLPILLFFTIAGTLFQIKHTKKLG